MTSPYYRPSGRVPLKAIPIALLGSIAVLPAAFAYAWLIRHAAFIFNFFIAFGFSLAVGGVVKYVAAHGKVRNVRWMSGAGYALGLAAWYCQWAAWTAMSLHDNAAHPVGASLMETFVNSALHPWSMVGQAHDISRIGTIDIIGWRVTGGLLAAVWLVELWLLVGMPAMMGRMRAADPFCEAADRWAEEINVPRRFAFLDEPAAVRQLLETDPQQTSSVLVPCAEASPNYAEVVLHGAGGAESYVSITNVVVTPSEKGDTKKEAQAVLAFLRLPDISADELLSQLMARRANHPDADKPTERPTPPELVAALDHLQAEQYEAAVQAASPFVASEQSSLRTDANRLCALASSRLGHWSEALGYWEKLIDDEPTAHNALQLATSSVMAGDVQQGVAWVEKARALNAASGEMPGMLILTNFVTALTQAGQTTTAMQYLHEIRQAYLEIRVTDPTVLYVNRIPPFSAFLGNSAPVVRAALNKEQGRGWYAAMLPHLDDRGNAELSEWLESHFSNAPS